MKISPSLFELKKKMPSDELGFNCSCVVCEWSEGTKDYEYSRSELYDHFKTARHISNWQRWMLYLQDQDIGADYVKDWLKQHKLLSLHQHAISSSLKL